jgi:hypothetical protein
MAGKVVITSAVYAEKDKNVTVTWEEFDPAEVIGFVITLFEPGAWLENTQIPGATSVQGTAPLEMLKDHSYRAIVTPYAPGGIPISRWASDEVSIPFSPPPCAQ